MSAIGRNVKCINRTFERSKGGGNILGSPDFEAGDIETAGPRCRLNLVRVQYVGSVANIGHDRQPA